MAVQTVPATSDRPAQAQPLPLENGDRLSRGEFKRRYAARLDLKKAELIEGVVYMPSPVRASSHAGPHAATLALRAPRHAAFVENLRRSERSRRERQ